jgi:hypothetical protein
MPEDIMTRGMAMGNAAILAHLLRSLVTAGVLSDDQISHLMQHARDSLLGQGTDVAAAASGHVIYMMQAFHVANVQPQGR